MLPARIGIQDVFAVWPNLSGFPEAAARPAIAFWVLSFIAANRHCYSVMTSHLSVSPSSQSATNNYRTNRIVPNMVLAVNTFVVYFSLIVVTSLPALLYMKLEMLVPRMVLSADMIDTDKLRREARREGIESGYQLAKRFRETGYEYSNSQALRLWNGTHDPRLSTLERLCEILKCDLSDITVSVKTKNAHKPTATKRGSGNKRNGRKARP